MARWWWHGEGWENIFFKRVPTGWVFQALSPWPFGRRRDYLVSETQRAEIIAFLDHVTWRHIIAALLFATIVSGLMALALWLTPASWGARLLPILLVCIVADCLVRTYFWLALRPLLAGGSRTTERITFTERLRALAAVVPVGPLILFAILLAIVFAFSAYLTLASSRWDIDGLIATPLLGLMLAYCVALLNAKHKTPAGPGS
jgi:hypothetical protein